MNVRYQSYDGKSVIEIYLIAVIEFLGCNGKLEIMQYI